MANGETVADFLGSKITADGDCSHEIKRRLLLGRKVMINLNSIFKSKDITLPTKVCLVKAMVFPMVMSGCESWTVKKAERWRIDAFELCCWRRLLRVPWTSRRSNQSILKEISPGCSLLGLMLKLKLQYLATWCEELTHWKRPWCWERLSPEGEGDDRGWDGWMASPTQWTWVQASSGRWWRTGKPGMLQSMGSQRVEHDWVTEQQQSGIYKECLQQQQKKNKQPILKNGHWTWIYISPRLHKHETNTWKDAQHHWPLGNANRNHNEISLDTNNDGYILKRDKEKVK